jgi:carbamate kinase
MQRSELSRHPVSKGGLGYPIDMDICGADTQGSIGHMFFVAYNDSLAKLSLSSMPQLVSVLTPVEVSRADPGFVRPTKPVGVGYDTEAEAKEAMKREAWDGYAFYPATNRWRRLVASPKPVKIGGIEAVKMLYESDKFLVVCGIGGGVPYSINPDRTIRREAAVIDKDLESAMMAVQLGIPEFYISTAIDFVKLDFGKPNERNLLSMSLQDLNKLLAEDALRSKKDKQFGEGAMEPKLQAVQYFLQNSVSKDAKAYITHVSNLHDALVNSKNCSVFGKHIETIIGSVVRK